MSTFQPPRWMRASGGWPTMTDAEAGRRLFHAYVDDHALCDPPIGLLDGARPTEADLADLCLQCAVLLGSVPAPDLTDAVVRHLDGDPINNDPRNLRIERTDRG